MRAYEPGFRLKRPIGTLFESSLVHEDPKQLIQGGSAGEHYHVTTAELARLQELVNPGIPIYEPVTAAGEILFDNNGDVLMDHGGSYVT